MAVLLLNASMQPLNVISHRRLVVLLTKERVAFVAASRVDLISKLVRIGGGNWEEFNRGRVKRERVWIAADGLMTDSIAAEALSRRDLERLGRLWVDGVTINWRDLLNRDDVVQRVSLVRQRICPRRGCTRYCTGTSRR